MKPRPKANGEFPLQAIEDLLSKSGIQRYDKAALVRVLHTLQYEINQVMCKAIEVAKYFRQNTLTGYNFLSATNVDEIQHYISNLSDEHHVFPPHTVSVMSWFYSIGLPQYAPEALFLTYMDHSTHQQKAKHKQEWDRTKSATTVILDLLSAPHEHKIKMLYEIEQLKKQLQEESDSTFTDNSEDYMTKEENYMKFLGRFNCEVKIVEDQYRMKLLERNPNEYVSSLGNELLIDVFAEKDSFQYQELSSFAGWQGDLLMEKIKKPRTGSSITSNFIQNWERFTRKAFEGVDWSNLVVAGGAVLELDFEENDHPFNTSDIDVFIYGLSPEEATKKILSVCSVINKNTSGCGRLLISQHSVTLLGIYPLRHIQFVLRLYRNISEVLIGFDIDCCSVAFDGTKVYGIPRSRRAINTKCNITDVSRRSLTYESRLIKYADRQFAVAVPGLQLEYLDKYKLPIKTENATGLVKLLVHHIQDSKNSSKQRNPILRRRKAEQILKKETLNGNQEILRSVSSLSTRKHGYHIQKESDYGWVPAWGMTTQTMINNLVEAGTKEFKMKDGSIIHFCALDNFYQYPLQWVIDNPGRQLFTGSFHPIEDSAWENRSAWDRRVAPKEGLTFKEIFERKTIIRDATHRAKAGKVLSRFQPYLGSNLIDLLLQYLSPRDYGTLNAVCKIEIQKIKAAPVTELPLPNPSSSVFLGGFTCEGQPRDLFSDSFEALIYKTHPGLTISDSTNRILHSIVYWVTTHVTLSAVKLTNLKRQHRNATTSITKKRVQIALKSLLRGEIHAKAINTRDSTKFEQVYKSPFDQQLYQDYRYTDIDNALVLWKAGLIINPINIRLLMHHICNKSVNIDRESNIFLAGVVEHLITEILEMAGTLAKANSSAVVEPAHISYAIKKDVELHATFASVLFADSFEKSKGASLWGFCFGPEVKLQNGVEEMFNKISNNFVTKLVENVIPFLVVHKRKSVQVEQVLAAVYNVHSSSGNLIPLGYLKVEGSPQLFISHIQAEFDALLNSTSTTTQSQESDNNYIDITHLNLPSGYFRNTITQSLQRFSPDYTITAKAELYIQHITECVIQQWSNPFLSAAQIANRPTEITPDDIEMGLSVSGLLVYLGKNTATIQAHKLTSTAVCTSELDDAFLEENNLTRDPKPDLVLYNPKTFSDRTKFLRRGHNIRCWTYLSNNIAMQVHEIRQIKEFSIPKTIFSRYLATHFYKEKYHVQIPALIICQEMVESSFILRVKQALKYVEHSGSEKGVLTDEAMKKVFHLN